MKKVFTVGVFDLLHFGHVELFRRAKQYGDYLIVAVQDDETVLKYKPEAKLVCPITDRVYMVDAIKYVNQVVIYKDIDAIVRQVDFDVFVVGEDQTHDGFVLAKEYCRKQGREVVVLPRTEGISSSILKNLIKQK